MSAALRAKSSSATATATRTVVGVLPTRDVGAVARHDQVSPPSSDCSQNCRTRPPSTGVRVSRRRALVSPDDHQREAGRVATGPSSADG